MTRKSCFFFFNDTATTEIYTLSLHDALPIFDVLAEHGARVGQALGVGGREHHRVRLDGPRSEEHTSELQSRQYLVCRLLLEKKKNHGTKALHARSRSSLNYIHANILYAASCL